MDWIALGPHHFASRSCMHIALSDHCATAPCVPTKYNTCDTRAHILAPCMRTFPRLCALHTPAQLPALHVYHHTIIPTLARSSPNNPSIVHALHMRHSHVFPHLAHARIFPRLALSARLSRACRDMEWTAPALRFTPGPTSNMTSIMQLLLHAPWQFVLCTSSHGAFPRFARHHSARSHAITAAFNQVHSVAKYCLNDHHYRHLNHIS
jgi:hypothetical protein